MILGLANSQKICLSWELLRILNYNNDNVIFVADVENIRILRLLISVILFVNFSTS